MRKRRFPLFLKNKLKAGLELFEDFLLSFLKSPLIGRSDVLEEQEFKSIETELEGAS